MKLKLLRTNIMFIIAVFFVGTIQALPINSTIKVSGIIKDKSASEPLVGATVYVNELKTGTATDIDGKFALKLPNGNYNLTISYIGYKTEEKKLSVKGELFLTILLEKDSKTFDDVVVSSKRNDDNITRTEMSVQKLKIQEVRNIPALMGEVDIIKVIQMLPGVQPVSEGGSGFSVRGGNIDQNLILIDEAPVYNASHLMGFFSVFNNDIVDNIELYKGDIPAAYGGRLSSLLKIDVAGGNDKQFEARGGIGTISSRLTIDGPLFNDKTTFILGGRRSYADIFLPLAPDEALHDVTLYFYDLNLKLRHRINNRNTLVINGYMGNDEFGQSSMSFGFGNKVASASWLHTYNEDMGSKITFFMSDYGYKTSAELTEANTFKWTSNIRDFGIRYDNTLNLDPDNTIKFGATSTLHKFYPGFIEAGENAIYESFELSKNSALEWSFYGLNTQKIGERITLKYGLRFSIFQNVGPGTIFNYDNNYNVIDSTIYRSGDVYNVYQGLEPRAGIMYKLNNVSSVKASYSRTCQYVHLASNSTGGFPMDLWVASNPNIKPQIANQVAVGYFRNFWFNQIETSAELYYKKMENTIDYKDHANLLLNPHLDGELRFGSSYSYGAEFQVKFNTEKVNGWVSYTLSKTTRDIPLVNGGEPYRAPFDRPNNISVVLNYKILPQLEASLNWVYSTGTPMTVPSGKYEIDGAQLVFYGKTDRNAYRMPDYHRLDLGLTWFFNNNNDKRFKSDLNLSIYNAYSRHNAWIINFEKDKNTGETVAVKTYLFGIIPSLTYNFRF